MRRSSSDENADRKPAKALVAHKMTATSLLTVPLSGDDVGEEGKVKFIFDSGATCHMINSTTEYLSEVSYERSEVYVAGGGTIPAIGTGKLECYAVDQDGKPWDLVMMDVLIVPDLKGNLLSAYGPPD
jgi:hypothetical protein